MRYKHSKLAKVSLQFAAAAAIAVGLAACGGGTTTPNLPQIDQGPPTVASPCPAQSLGWTVGTAACSAPVASTAVGGTLTLTNTVVANTGTANFACVAGAWGAPTAATCAVKPVQATTCPAQTLTWTVGTFTCSAAASVTNVGSSVSLTNSAAGNTGAASYACSATGWGAAATATCTATPVACTGKDCPP